MTNTTLVNRRNRPAPYAAASLQEPIYAAELHAVTKRFGQIKAVDALDLHVRRGEVLALLGPNGAGKTTAVSLMLGLLKPDEGTVKLFGHHPNSVAAKVRVGSMLQISGLPATITVREHLTSFASYYPNSLGVTQLIEEAGLSEVADRQYGKLSGGQQQRLHFALAIVGNPDLLFLDEPTAGLDVASRRTFWRQVRSFLVGGRTVVLTTHYLDEADAVADRIVVMGRGKVLADGTPAEIKSKTAGRRVSAVTSLALNDVAAIEGVSQVERVGATTAILTSDSESVVRRLLDLDPHLTDLEVTGAGLDEAFLALTAPAAPTAATAGTITMTMTGVL